MTFLELYEKLEMPAGMVERLEIVRPTLDFSKVETSLQKMMNKDTAEQAHQEILAAFPEDEWKCNSMLCQLEVVRRQYDVFMEMGISEEIFVDTMKAYTRFVSEHFEKYNEYVYDRDGWSYRQASMDLFRIGCLEYEFLELEGEKVLSVHIPSDANMKDENVGKSIAMAKEFMAKYYPDYKDSRMYCNSWLLAPKLQELLPETSNIVRFQKRFDLVRHSDEGQDCVYWVFKAPKDTPIEDLREDTSLQRKIKAVLLSGGGIGYGAGYMR